MHVPSETGGAATERTAGTSPWGPEDEIGRLSLITMESRANILSRVAGGNVYDLPVEYFIRITRDDLQRALLKQQQQVTLQAGDVVLIRTGRMQHYENTAAFMSNPSGLGLGAAKYLVEESGAMIIGADNLSLEAFPSELEDDYVPVHTYLLAEQGTPILELVYLEELARDHVYEFAFIGGSLKFRGADAAPLRPIAFPLQKQVLNNEDS